MKTIRVGNGQGFWGDNVDAPVELLRGGEIDYIGMDYLAEVTLSIMMRQKLKDPSLGYATDFIGFIRRVLPEYEIVDIPLTHEIFSTMYAVVSVETRSRPRRPSSVSDGSVGTNGMTAIRFRSRRGRSRAAGGAPPAPPT